MSSPEQVPTSISLSPEIAPTPPPFAEPPPVPAEAFVQIQPIAPASAEPFPIVTAAASSPGVVSIDTAVAEWPVKKRPAKKLEENVHQPLELAGLELSADETSNAQMEPGERVLSSDGATRLIVTAYIGIGNRLFIRGEGPGLTWEKGVPLNFVSIGKWRWETNDAVTPVQFKLLKNDEVECAGLGTQSLDAGYQQEVTARF